MVLVGGLVAGVSVLAFARGETSVLRLGYSSLLAVSLPGFVLMRIGAEWIYSKEGWDELSDDPGWLGTGRVIADAGGVILLVALIVGAFGVRRLHAGKGHGLLKTTLVLSVVLLGAYVVAVWAMAGKPDY